jgi:hypothetical protein
LINVKIEKVAKNGEYEELQQELKDYYKGNANVKDV